MADTKVSALTAVTTPASTDEFPVNQGGISKKATLAQVRDFILTAPVFAAGSASANSWPKLTAGTLLTTPEDGAIEKDANCVYMTTDAGNRGVVPLWHYIRQTSTYTLTSQTAAQKLFNAVANGTLTLETGLYHFESMIHLSSMSATSGNATFELLGAGTATLGSIAYMTIGRDNAISGAGGALGGTFSVASATAAAAVTAGTAAAMFLTAKGMFEVTAAGTIIPSTALLTAAAAVVGVGSYFMCHRIGATGATSVGQWS